MHILFIVNPISGLGLGKELPEKIRRIPEYDSIPYDIVFTEYAGHARKLVEDARQEGKYTHIVAVGGDGTVNEVGGALCGSDVAFGVVSLGSGNGFARHLGYSVFMTKALKQVLTDQFAQIDVLEMNGKYSLNVSGVGFDAEVAHEFNHLKLRGVFSYIYAAIKGHRFGIQSNLYLHIFRTSFAYFPDSYRRCIILISFMRKYQISDSPRSLIEGQRRFAIGIGRFRNFQSSLLQSYLRYR